MRPILFEVHGYAVPAYGTVMVAMFVTGLLMLRRQVRGLGLDDTQMMELAAIAALAIVGWWASRLILARSGLAGAPHFNGLPILALGAFAYLSYLRWQRLPAEAIFDAVAPIAALALAVQYGVGTLLAGTAFGKPTSLPWGLSFPPGSPAHRVYGGEPLHPLQLYLAAALLAVAAAARYLPARLPPGQRALATFIAIAVVYLATSPLRGGTTSLLAGQPARTSELVALFVIAYCTIMAWRRRHDVRHGQGLGR